MLAFENLLSELLLEDKTSDNVIGNSRIPAAVHSHSGGQEIIAGYRRNNTIESHPAVTPDDDDDDGQLASRNRRSTITSDMSPVDAGFFCSNPERNRARLVICTTSGDNLINEGKLRAICELDRTIRGLPEFLSLAERDANQKYCPSWTLTNYLMALTNRKSCHHLSHNDVSELRNMSAVCVPFYRAGQLHRHCWDGHNLCPDVPDMCCRENWFYHVLHYITDDDARMSNFTRSQCSLMLLPVWSGQVALPLYKALHQHNLTVEGAGVVGIEMGLKDSYLDVRLWEDSVLMLLALGAVLIILWIYVASLFVTIMNALAVFFPILLSYSLYSFIFRLTFFPFMNLLTCVIMIAVGADALVIYARLWTLAKSEKNDGKFEKVVYETMRHGFQTIMISSLTAASALFADAANPIVAIRCFSIFSGLTVLVHYIFVVTWLPATVIVADKWGSSLYSCRQVFLQKFCDSKVPLCQWLFHCHYIVLPFRQFAEYFRIFFEKLLPCIIIRLKWIWIALFVVMTAAACINVFYFPRLQLSTSRWLHLWDKRHPFEQYGMLKERFDFEREITDIQRRLPIRFVWGVIPGNTAAMLDPYDKGLLEYDHEVDFLSEESQSWMLQFCDGLKQQPFVSQNTDSFCYMAAFKRWLENVECSIAPICCGNLSFPLNPLTFHQCSQIFHRTFLHDSTGTKLSHGPNFDSQGRFQSLIVATESAQSFSYIYQEIKTFYDSVDSWFQSQLSSAPVGLKNGWFTSELEYFDLQDSLISGTTSALVIAFIVALLVMFLTTLNVCVSILAIVTIACIMVTSVAVLVVMEWKLNVLESTIITLGIGLSVDFTLHYSVAYCCSEADERELKTNHLITEMASPVTVSALTTFLAGAFMAPSDILIYRQIGLFIMIVISISWVYSTVFFSALLAAIGPQADFLQLHYPSCPLLCCRTDPSKLVEKSLQSSIEFTTHMISPRSENDLPRRAVHVPPLPQPLSVASVTSVAETPEPAPKVLLTLHVDPQEAEEDLDSVGELGSLPTSRGPSRGASLVRKHSRGLFSWDYVMQKLPLTRHFSVTNSSVMYIDADVRSNVSDNNPDMPAVMPNLRPDVPEVWVRRTD
ncbi:protein dispatched homolog 1-like isoform X2 [Paramacrobiotus metropolitanus]|nr:protein dispatched homolog 1-like isoform X2 [Paramacrobiotus metropolitanus]